MSLTFKRPLETFELNDTILGHNYAYWIERFWTTAFYKHKKKVKEPVYSVNGFVETEKDELDVPSERAILLCPIKWISLVRKSEFDEVKKQIMIDRCHYETDIIHDMTMLINDELVSEQTTRAISGFFECDYGENVAISEGYWLFLKPDTLDKGLYHVNSFASCARGKVQIPQEYKLRIV